MKIAILGECMVELSQQPDGLYKMGYGGDTLNTAVYLSRNGGACEFITAIGDDAYSLKMKDAWIKEGVGVTHVHTAAGETSGLYIIENDETGERFFSYWRKNAPVRQLLKSFPGALDHVKPYPYFYLTGITLSLFDAESRATLFAFLSSYRQQGGQVVFDNNYRPKNWENNQQAVQVFQTMMSLTDVALLSFEDEVEMYGVHSTEACLHRWKNAGVNELVIKNGADGCLVFDASEQQNQVTTVPLQQVVKPVDTTAAGDSFNGAYLASRLKGKSVAKSILDAQYCAGVVIMHKGAIISPEINVSREEVV